MNAIDNSKVHAEDINLGLLLTALAGDKDAPWFSITTAGR